MKKTLYFITVACCAGIGPIAADTLVLNGGTSFSGIITEETPTNVTLKRGSGQMVINKSMIQRIERDSAEERASQVEEWKRTYFYQQEYVPPGLEEPAALFRDLKEKHQEITSAQHQKTIMRISSQIDEDRLAVLRKKLMKLRDELQTQAATVSRLKTEQNTLILENNARISEINDPETDESTLFRLRKETDLIRQKWTRKSVEIQPEEARLAALQKETNEALEEEGRVSKRFKQAHEGLSDQARAQSSILPFTKAIHALQASLRKHDTPADRQKYPWFFEGLEAGLSDMAGALQTETAAFQKQSGAILVQAVLNGNIEATLILDTGASATTISKDLAERLGISLDDKPAGLAILADGSMTPSTLVTLDSIQVGTAVRQDVVTSVLKNPPQPGIDGLLGMSFLKYFTVHLNSESNQVELLHLSADAE